MPQQTNRVDELVNALRRQGRVKELEAELKSMDLSLLTPTEQQAWWHLYGIAAFREGRDAEARERFEEAYRRFPGCAEIRFSLAQQYIRAQDIEKGFALFRTCHFPEIPREYALAQARYAYIWSRYDDGHSFIWPFFDAYKQLKTLDDHFLYMRGLPFFGSWWAYLAAFGILSGNLAELVSVTEYVAANCHEYDFEYLVTEMMSFRDDRPEYLLEPLEERLSRISKSDFPTGYLRMNIAVARSRIAASLETAQATLNGVLLSGRDFPWLEDIRTLALAEAAYRFGEPGMEREHIAAFLTCQPLLFEPDHALQFHLLRYQERLKEEQKIRWGQRKTGSP